MLAVSSAFVAAFVLQVPATSAPAPVVPTVASVTDLGAMARHPAILGRDNARSAKLGGTSVWTYGDTPLSKARADGSHWADNTISWTKDLDASNGVGAWSDFVDANGVPSEFLPLTPDERAYNAAHQGDSCAVKPCNAEYALWPGEVVADPARNRLLVFYGVIHRVIGQPNFTPRGSGIAIAKLGKQATRPIVSPASRTPTLMFGTDEFGLGNASVVVGTMLYNYGCFAEWIVTRCQVARVPLRDVLVKTRWRYFAGNGRWTRSSDNAAVVFDGGAAGTSVHWSPYLKAYLAVYSQNFSNDVMYRVSTAPEGPWSAARRLLTGLPSYDGSANYAAAAHAEYATGNGRTQFVTYVRNTGFLRQEVRQVRVVFNAPAG